MRVKFTVQMDVEAEVRDDGTCSEVDSVVIDGRRNLADMLCGGADDAVVDFLAGLAEAQYRNRMMAQKEAKADDDRE